MKNFKELCGSPIFNKLPEDIIEHYFSQYHKRKYRKKEKIFAPGEHSDYIYIVISGRIRVFLSYPTGKEFTLTLLNVGDIYSGHTRAFGEALVDSEVILLPVASFRKLLTEVPLFAMGVISVLGDSLRNSINTIESLVFKEVNKRLYQFIYSLAFTASIHGEITIHIDLGLTHQQIATIVGSTRQTVTTFFNNLQKEGIISLGKEKLDILDFETIKNRAKDDDG